MTLSFSDSPLGSNFGLRALAAPRLWTHARLGPETVLRPPDLLFVPSHVLPLIGPPRQVVTIHDLGYHFFPAAHTARRRLELRLTTAWSVRRASRIIAISQATSNALKEYYRADPAKIRVVYHGLNPAFAPASDSAIAAVRERYNLGQPYILYVGTLQPRKNLVRLIEAFAKADLPRETLLVIAGKRGWLSQPIEAAAERSGLGERVRLTGYLPDSDLPALLSGALAFAFPSLYEGFGMPVLEAMACGTPVLSSTTSALPEVAGDAALLVEPTDDKALQTALERLTQEPALRASLRERGLKWASEFSWQRCARETLAVLTDATSDV